VEALSHHAVVLGHLGDHPEQDTLA
jgi:hypothetical protein